MAVKHYYHALVIGPPEQATAVLHGEVTHHPGEHLWLYCAPENTGWPAGNAQWQSSNVEDLYAMWRGARQTIDEHQPGNWTRLVIVGDDPFTGPPDDVRITVIADALGTLQRGLAHDVRMLLSAPDRASVPGPILAWFDEHPDTGVVIDLSGAGYGTHRATA